MNATRKRFYRAPIADRLNHYLTEPDEAGCVHFTGWTDAHGYGRFKVGRVMRKPHRVAWELVNGPIPEGLCVCHRCDQPSCCNVDHLFLGTHQDNMRDMAAKGRQGNGGAAAAKRSGETQRIQAQRRRADAAVHAGHPCNWKMCSRCEEWQAPEAFGRNVARPDGLQVYCRSCYAAYVRDHRIRRGKVK